MELLKQTFSTPSDCHYRYELETIKTARKLPRGSVAEYSHKTGMVGAECLIVVLDSLLKYAKAHQKRFETPLAEDYVLGVEWLEAIKGVRGLLNGNGQVANVAGITTDSKDNRSCEAMFWTAIAVAGFKEEEVV